MQISENVTLSKIREAEHNLTTVFFWRFQCLNKETGKKSTYLNAEVTTMQGKYIQHLSADVCIESTNIKWTINIKICFGENFSGTVRSNQFIP